jgi:hypothetical protein
MPEDTIMSLATSTTELLVQIPAGRRSRFCSGKDFAVGVSGGGTEGAGACSASFRSGLGTAPYVKMVF